MENVMLEEIKGIHFEKIMDAELIKPWLYLVIPYAAPINRLCNAGLLHLLLAPSNTKVVIIQSVFNEIISDEFKGFVEVNLGRFKIVKTSVCTDDEAKVMQGEPLGKRRVELAIADFLLNFIDGAPPGVVGESTALVVGEEREVARFQADRAVFGFPENIHFITLECYLHMLEQDGLINSFDAVWRQIMVDDTE